MSYQCRKHRNESWKKRSNRDANSSLNADLRANASFVFGHLTLIVTLYFSTIPSSYLYVSFDFGATVYFKTLQKCDTFAVSSFDSFVVILKAHHSAHCKKACLPPLDLLHWIKLLTLTHKILATLKCWRCHIKLQGLVLFSSNLVSAKYTSSSRGIVAHFCCAFFPPLLNIPSPKGMITVIYFLKKSGTNYIYYVLEREFRLEWFSFVRFLHRR